MREGMEKEANIIYCRSNKSNDYTYMMSNFTSTNMSTKIENLITHYIYQATIVININTLPQQLIM